MKPQSAFNEQSFAKVLKVLGVQAKDLATVKKLFGIKLSKKELNFEKLKKMLGLNEKEQAQVKDLLKIFSNISDDIFARVQYDYQNSLDVMKDAILQDQLARAGLQFMG
jgi:hypothetical protein